MHSPAPQTRNRGVGARNPRYLWVPWAQESSSILASRIVFLICAPSQKIATDKAWGRLPKTSSIPGILGAGVFLPLSSDFRNPLPRFIPRNPRPTAPQRNPLITRQVPGALTAPRHHGRKCLPSSGGERSVPLIAWQSQQRHMSPRYQGRRKPPLSAFSPYAAAAFLFSIPRAAGISCAP